MLNWRRDPDDEQRMQPEAMARKRQAESMDRLDQATLLCGRVQLDPTTANRQRLQAFLSLIALSLDPQSEG